MQIDYPDSPEPTPIPSAKPTILHMNFIKLKSLKQERELKKCRTSRNSPEKPETQAPSLPQQLIISRTFKSADLTSRPAQKNSIIARAKKSVQEEATTRRGIPSKQIDLTRKSVILAKINQKS